MFHKCLAVAGMGGRLATIDMGRKFGCVPLFRGRGAGSPSNTKSPGPRPISEPNGILINPAISPLQTWAENWGCAPPPFGGWTGSHLKPWFHVKIKLF